jgi:catechol 2,3-dioxygenase-like lactoylglutathione lyase family enzyme
MARVNGLGGVFFKAQDAERLRSWYREHLGLPVEDWGGMSFEWREKDDPSRTGATVWSIFPASSRYFDPSPAPFMVNYRVDDLDRVLAELRSEGVEVDPKVEESEFGRFGWVMDPEGNRIELWEPPERQKERSERGDRGEE